MIDSEDSNDCIVGLEIETKAARTVSLGLDNSLIHQKYALIYALYKAVLPPPHLCCLYMAIR